MAPVHLYLCLLVGLLSIPQSKASCENSNYQLVGGRCLRLQPKRTKSYDHAQRACLADGAHLVTPHSLAEQENLLSWSQIPQKKGVQLWIGLKTTPQWTWAHDAPLSDSDWTNWGNGRKNKKATKSSCVILRPKKSVWAASGCSSRRGTYAICQMEADIVPTVTPTCSHGWSRLGAKCYKHFSHSVDYSTAQAKCSEQGGTLAMPKTDAISDVLEGISGYSESWLGLNDIATEGQFVFADGSSTVWTNWNGGEPNNSDGNEDCVVMRWTGWWNDFPCSQECQYFCEKNADI